jgi:hypothetical protein
LFFSRSLGVLDPQPEFQKMEGTYVHHSDLLALHHLGGEKELLDLLLG